MVPPLPTVEAFGALVSMLIGKNVSVKRGTPLTTPNVRGAATYVDAAGTLIFVVLIDVAFLASAGAALALIPLPLVTEAVRTGKPSEGLVENAYEVLNVAASLFNDVEGTPVHVKVERLMTGPLDAELAKRIVKPGARFDRDIAIPGYLEGKVSFIALSQG
jgi:hypothetical protein